jgi:hypothetical protein
MAGYIANRKTRGEGAGVLSPEHFNGKEGGTAKSIEGSVPRFPQSNHARQNGRPPWGLLHVVMLSGCTRGDKELLLVLR